MRIFLFLQKFNAKCFKRENNVPNSTKIINNGTNYHFVNLIKSNQIKSNQVKARINNNNKLEILVSTQWGLEPQAHKKVDGMNTQATDKSSTSKAIHLISISSHKGASMIKYILVPKLTIQ